MSVREFIPRNVIMEIPLARSLRVFVPAILTLRPPFPRPKSRRGSQKKEPQAPEISKTPQCMGGVLSLRLSLSLVKQQIGWAPNYQQSLFSRW